MEEKLSVGQIVDNYCGKCKTERNHTIVVIDEETVTKVRCNFCGGSHKFTGTPRQGRGRKSKAVNGPIDEAITKSIWEACISEATGRNCPYSMAAKYRVGDIVDHFEFGKGVVLKIYPNRCDMLFKDKSRLMVSANQ